MGRFFIAVPAILALLTGCGRTSQVEIPFILRYGGQEIGCEQPASGLSLTDLRFYAHALYLTDEAGKDQLVRFQPDGRWQTGRVALLDLENGQGDCINGTDALHSIVRGEVPAGEYSGLRFELGVPEDLNHDDPMQAQPPLNYTIMHWHWRSGYQFLRAGVRSDGDSFRLHVGSARCEGVIGDIRGCKSANRARAELPAFVPGRDAVAVDIQALMQGTDLSDGVPGVCESGPSDQDCAAPYSALGIDIVSGDFVEPARIFQAVRHH